MQVTRIVRLTSVPGSPDPGGTHLRDHELQEKIERGDRPLPARAERKRPGARASAGRGLAVRARRRNLARFGRAGPDDDDNAIHVGSTATLHHFSSTATGSIMDFASAWTSRRSNISRSAGCRASPSSITSIIDHSKRVRVRRSPGGDPVVPTAVSLKRGLVEREVYEVRIRSKAST